MRSPCSCRWYQRAFAGLPLKGPLSPANWSMLGEGGRSPLFKLNSIRRAWQSSAPGPRQERRARGSEPPVDGVCKRRHELRTWATEQDRIVQGCAKNFFPDVSTVGTEARGHRLNSTTMRVAQFVLPP